MTQGFASDFGGSEEVMQNPDATLSLDLSNMPPQQALVILQAAGRMEEADTFDVGLAANGNDDADFGYIEFHFTVGEALSILDQCGAVDMPEQPEQPAEGVENVEEI